MRDLASVGLTTREACGDTVRNVMGCHLAGACPYEVLDISPWAEATFQHFLRHPLAQRLPRKFKINFSGCDTDCGQAMFNDVGVIATTRTLDDGTRRGRVPGVRRRRPRRQPAPRARARGVHRPRGPAAHHRVGPAGLRPDRQPRQQAAGPHEVAGRHHRLRRAPAPHLQGAQVPARLVDLARRHPRGRPEGRRRPRRARPAGVAPTAIGQGTAGHAAARTDPYERWERRQRRARRRQGHRVGHRLRPPRRHHHRPVPGPRLDPARARRRGADHQPPEPRLPGPHRGPAARSSSSASPPSAWPSPGAELARDVVACPGADTCNLAVTQSRGLADAIGAALEEAGLAEVGGVRTNISGCTNSLRPAPHRRHRLLRRRAPGPRPVGPRLPDAARRLRRPGADPLRREGAAPARQERPRGRRPGRAPVRRRARAPARTFRSWIDRVGGVEGHRRRASRTSTSSRTPTEAPEFYVDYGETGPYVAEIGESECAT